jgi:hypothetical protein
MRTMILVFFLALAMARGAEPGFWQQLTAEERARAGLDALTPTQRAALNEMASRFAVEGPRATSGAVAAAATAIPAARAEKQPTKVAAESGEGSRIGLPPLKSAGDEKISSRIAGEFNGWTGTTIFKLENGQVWVQEDSNDHRWFKAVMNPPVEISQSMFGGWKLVVDGERGAWVRVKRVR